MKLQKDPDARGSKCDRFQANDFTTLCGQRRIAMDSEGFHRALVSAPFQYLQSSREACTSHSL
ncbi:hypothetical protein X777_06752 [Ooceraea biroi]|uniref:Uncharacterized protein n=1 Tax=Ooceraea biroi TaxID=2015173 RepID=A0A026X237_OOCBI|nr:hypothetical protein X777_06752 [Ooceraea biroi]